jgi:dimethylargininase
VLALTRAIPDTFADALAAVPPDPPIDVALARRQHAAYRAALTAAGARVELLAADDGCPDCCFIEDTAVIAGGLALVTRPGAPSRRAETAAVAAALAVHAPHLEVVHLPAPATLDGGDCLLVGATLHIGRSARTSDNAIAFAASVLAPRGLRVVALDLPAGVLHLQCVCTSLGDGRVLLAEGTLPGSAFTAAGIVPVPAEETYAANAVALASHVLVSDGFPRTRDVLERAGFTTHAVPTTEVRKADGSLTCLSLRVPPRR